jgi:hypothetical protein
MLKKHEFGTNRRLLVLGCLSSSYMVQMLRKLGVNFGAGNFLCYLCSWVLKKMVVYGDTS